MLKQSQRTKYKLQIEKHFSRHSRKLDVRISVVDCEKGSFPSNFVCQLPRNPSSIAKGVGFAKIFEGSDRVIIALQLLNAALDELIDDEFRLEIERRINLLKAA